MIPVLYSFRRCPYAIRARLALDASGQRCELREIALREKPAQMLQASPKGTVPVLVIAAGEVIDESLDIMLWALGRDDPDHWLTPDADSLHGMLALIARFDSHFKPHLDRYKYPDRFEGADSLASRTEACLDLQLLESDWPALPIWRAQGFRSPTWPSRRLFVSSRTWMQSGSQASHNPPCSVGCGRSSRQNDLNAS